MLLKSNFLDITKLRNLFKIIKIHLNYGFCTSHLDFDIFISVWRFVASYNFGHLALASLTSPRRTKQLYGAVVFILALLLTSQNLYN